MRSTPGPLTLSSASWAVSNALLAAVSDGTEPGCWRWPAATYTPNTSAPATATNASSATAARRCVSIRDARAGDLAGAGLAAREHVLDAARSRARTRCRPRCAPWSRRRRSAAALAVTVSARGIGDLSGAPASGSAGRTGTSVFALWVAPTSFASNASAPSLPLPSAATKRAWRCSIADCGWSVTSASLRASVPILATMFADTRHSESPTDELAAPDLGLELVHGQAAVPVRVGERRQAGLADEVGLGGADRGHVQLAAPDDGHRDADRPAVGARVPHPVAVALVGEPLVRDAHHLGQALPDARGLVVVVLVADGVGDHPRRFAGAVAGDPRRHQQVQVALRPRDGADGRLDDHDGVGRVGELVLLGDGTELQLEADGQETSLMVGATRVDLQR